MRAYKDGQSSERRLHKHKASQSGNRALWTLARYDLFVLAVCRSVNWSVTRVFLDGSWPNVQLGQITIAAAAAHAAMIMCSVSTSEHMQCQHNPNPA